MIEAQCPTCESQGPHEVQRDNGTTAEVICRDCFHGFRVVLC